MMEDIDTWLGTSRVHSAHPHIFERSGDRTREAPIQSDRVVAKGSSELEEEKRRA
jgi:hypothetical protein